MSNKESKVVMIIWYYRDYCVKLWVDYILEIIIYIILIIFILKKFILILV